MRPNQNGFFQLIIGIIILVLVVSLWRVNLKELFASEITQQNFRFVIDLLHEGWQYVKSLFFNLIWNPLTSR